MKSAVASMVSVGTILLAIILYQMVYQDQNQKGIMKEKFEKSVESALQEVVIHNPYQIQNANEMVAAFMQSLIQKVPEETELTVKILAVNWQEQKMEIQTEALYKLPSSRKERCVIYKNVAL